MNATFFEASGVRVLGAVFNRLPDDASYYSLANCRVAVTAYFTQVCVCLPSPSPVRVLVWLCVCGIGVGVGICSEFASVCLRGVGMGLGVCACVCFIEIEGALV